MRRFESFPLRFSNLSQKLSWGKIGAWLGLGLLLLGIAFRLINLETKIFWVDEVATAVRVGGYTQAELTELSLSTAIGVESVGVESVGTASVGTESAGTESVRTAADFLQLVHGSLDRPPSATLQALLKSPEHAPLYFLLARGWADMFGRSPLALRSLSVCLSLLALPCLFWVCLEWLGQPLVSWLAVGLMAISPLFIAYAQEARPYSLWVLLLLLSGGCLLRALRRDHWRSWLAYGVTLTLALYTSLLSLPIVLAQAVYVWGVAQGRSTPSMRRAVGAIALSLVAFLPWVVVILSQWDTLQRNTAWMQQSLDLPALIGIWLYSLSILVFDFPVAPLQSPLTVLQILTSVVILGFFGVALRHLIQQTPFRTWGFVVALAFPTPVLLVLADSLLGGQRSTAPRYWIAAHIGLVLLIAAWLSLQIHPSFPRRSTLRLWPSVLVIVLTLSLASSIGNLGRSPRYLKSRNLHNGAIATLINQAPSARLLTAPENLYDLISLSHSLNPTTPIQILSLESGQPRPTPQAPTPQAKASCAPTTFLFNPSQRLITSLEARPISLQQVYNPHLLIPTELALTLWRIHPPC